MTLAFKVNNYMWHLEIESMASDWHSITHVIFDVDGLLLDTERLYTKMMQAVCDPHGKEFTWDIKVKQMGHKEHESAQILIDELELPITVEEYLATLHRMMPEMFPEAALMPGVEKLVRHLHKHKVPMALATGGDSKNFKLKIHNHQDLFSLFGHAVFSTEDPDVANGKPAPDCFLVTAKRFTDNPDPKHILVFEDAPNGVEAGIQAGMATVWVPDPNVNRAVLKNQPTLILDSLTDFKPETFGLPAYDS